MEDNEVPDEFKNVISDFVRDILTTFPEYADLLVKYDLDKEDDVKLLYEYCSEIYPERFFDFLYKNDEIFEDDDLNTYFLPDIEFKEIWKANISDNTRDIIWKYLQLIVFSISKSLDSANMFGDTQKMFEAIDENELRDKLEKTIDEMSNMFDMSGMGMDMSGMGMGMGMDMSGLDMSGVMPDASEIHEHLNNLLDGKLGRLAAEIAEETASDLNLDLSDNENMMNVFQNLFKNPQKLMGMIKKVGNKLDEKIKSGEIKESEIMSEASDLMNKMKNMSGMKEMNKMFSQMGVPGMGKTGNVNFGAMQSKMKENMGKAKQRERMLKKLEERRAQKLQQEKQKQNNLENVKFVKKVYTKGEDVEKSSVKDKVKKKKKKKKKKKNKNKK